MGHLLTENRNGLIVEAEVTEAGTRQEWDADTTMLAAQGSRPGMTVGADRGYDTGEFVNGCRGLSITPHVAQKSVSSSIDGRTTGSWGYQMSQLKRKRIEECFGWMKEFGLIRELRHVGWAKTAWIFRFTTAAYNVTRLKHCGAQLLRMQFSQRPLSLFANATRGTASIYNPNIIHNQPLKGKVALQYNRLSPKLGISDSGPQIMTARRNHFTT